MSKKIVIKIGSSTLTTSESEIDYSYLNSLAQQIDSIKKAGWQPVIVTSAAIACGLEALGITKRPTDMPSLQAAASVGQSALSTAYAQAFAPYEIITSVVLLTRRDTADRTSYLHARDTLCRLLEMGVIPIVNENDTISVEQIKFGDNDTLAALVACLIEADLLVIFSDVDGLYESNPRKDPSASLISCVETIDESVLSRAGEAGSVAGSGGMITKIQAARVLMAAGIPMVICNGRTQNALEDITLGKSIGTKFAATTQKHEITPKKLWIALGDATKGTLTVDDGAKKALLSKGSSLLSVGIKSIEGGFQEGDIVDVRDSTGFLFARGKVAASYDEIALALGRTQKELKSNRLLRSLADKPIVHRDELVVFE